MYILFGENNASRRRVPIHLVDATDGITPKTGQTGSAKVSTDYGPPATSKNSIVEIDSTNMPGDYYLELSTAEIVNPGNLLVRVKTAASAEYVYPVQVVAFDPYAPISLQPGFNAVVAGQDIDYKRISKLMADEVGKVPKYEQKETDLMPISQSLQALFTEIRAIDIPKPMPTDLGPVMSKIEAVGDAVKAIQIPTTDLSPVLSELREAREEVKPGVEATRADLEAMLARIKEFFTTDIDAIKAEVQKVEKRLAKIPMIVMNNQPQEEEKPKFNAPKLI